MDLEGRAVRKDSESDPAPLPIDPSTGPDGRAGAPTLTPAPYEIAPVTDPNVDELVDRLHEQLRATEELPVDRTAGRWIGEAQAVAGDVAEGDPPASVVRERVGHVQQLLEEVEDAGAEKANERVAAAIDLSEEILDRTEG